MTKKTKPEVPHESIYCLVFLITLYVTILYILAVALPHLAKLIKIPVMAYYSAFGTSILSYWYFFAIPIPILFLLEFTISNKKLTKKLYYGLGTSMGIALLMAMGYILYILLSLQK